MQRITTREPDDSQLEVALLALKNAIPDEFGSLWNETEAKKAETEDKPE
jgi:uncharacterized protein YqhQ